MSEIHKVHMPRDGQKQVLFVNDATEQGNAEHHPVKCLDEPLPSMYDAMNALVPWVTRRCELPKGFAGNLTIRTVLIKPRTEGTSIQVTFVKELKDGDKLVWQAPQKAVEDDSVTMGLLKKVRAEAMKWYNGTRLQADLLDGQPTAAATGE